jgi:anti-sigma factor RsiW
MMCTSKDIKELLPIYLEQALERPEQERVEQHLGTCEDCRRELSLLRAMAGEPVPDPGEAFWGQMPSRVYREVREQQSETRQPGLSALWQNLLMPRWAWATAAVMVVAILSWMVLRPVHKDASVAVLPEDESPYAAVLVDESLDVATIAPDEFDSMGVWAEKELAVMTAGAGEVMANGSDTDIYEELVDMDGKALKRFSTMIDSLKREG